MIVGFDDVDLGEDPAAGAKRTFFPGEPGKERWVPIFRAAPVASQSDGTITREQFPLPLAWA